MSREVNTITISGNICRDAELRQAGETPVLQARLASSTYAGKSGDKPIFLGLKVFGSRAEALAPLLTKGKGVTVTGELNMDEYEKDGQKRTSFEINVRQLRLDPRRGEAGEGENSARTGQSAKLPF